MIRIAIIIFQIYFISMLVNSNMAKNKIIFDIQQRQEFSIGAVDYVCFTDYISKEKR